MEYDIDIKRAKFIETSTEIREMFSFANPEQIINSVKVYAGHFYGSMLWNLYGDGANRVFRSWNTCVKLAFGIPRWSHNYFVSTLAKPLQPLRLDMFCQYIGFVSKLLNHESPELRLLANIVARDPNSMTGSNLANFEKEFNLDPWISTTVGKLKKVYSFYPVPKCEEWRLPLLVKLLSQRRVSLACGEDVKIITELIDSLCSS